MKFYMYNYVWKKLISSYILFPSYILIEQGLQDVKCCILYPDFFLRAEPLKKKKKMDPQLIRQREERKKRKIEKQIRRLEKNASQLKPIDELEVPRTIMQEKE